MATVVNLELRSITELTDQDFINERSEDNISKDDLGMRGTITWEHVALIYLLDIEQSDAEAHLVDDLIGQLLVQLVLDDRGQILVKEPWLDVDNVLHLGENIHLDHRRRN